MKQILSLLVIVITALQVNAQAAEKTIKPYWVWGGQLSYLASANAKNKKDSKPIWAGNGYNAGLAFRYGDRWGITGRLGYASGKRNSSNTQAFANTLVTPPFTARVSGLKTNWSQVNIAAGPSVFLGNKYKGEISAVGGIGLGSSNTVTIDKYDAQTKAGTIYTVAEKKVKPFWEVGASYQVANIKKVGLGIKASYGSNGVTVGIVAWDWQTCCAVKCKACPGLIPSKVIEN